ncbi:MAG: ACT domain-containing protein, partial [Spartobacteria bacterium]|nr:ACT domain-containing protein [Spartobacteria bacterium]
MSDTYSMQPGQQISVSVQNEPGTLAELTSFLGDNDINVYALTLTGGIDHGYVRMVVDDHP